VDDVYTLVEADTVINVAIADLMHPSWMFVTTTPPLPVKVTPEETVLVMLYDAVAVVIESIQISHLDGAPSLFLGVGKNLSQKFGSIHFVVGVDQEYPVRGTVRYERVTGSTKVVAPLEGDNLLRVPAGDLFRVVL
jgi:hypothetical protein